MALRAAASGRHIQAAALTVLVLVAAWTTLPLKLQLHVAQLLLQVFVDALNLFVLHLDGLLLGVEHNVFHP